MSSAATPVLLVVDDNADDIKLVEYCLSHESYRILSASNGKSALKIIKREHPDLLLFDIMMPGIDGFMLCQETKSNPQTSLIPVILITGLTEREERLKGIKVGADDFLTKPVDRAELLARVKSLLRVKALTDQMEQAEDVIYSLATAIEERDPYTKGHSIRVSQLSVELAQTIGLPEQDQAVLKKAGLLHDVGKIGIDTILRKPGPLTKAEFNKVKKHPVKGEKICSRLSFAEPLLPIIRHHHEWWNGRGYPDGLLSKSTPIGARIMAVADAYDAMTSDRPYRAPMPPMKALDKLEDGAGRQWDPDLVAAFTKIIMTRHPRGIRKGYRSLI